MRQSAAEGAPLQPADRARRDAVSVYGTAAEAPQPSRPRCRARVAAVAVATAAAAALAAAVVGGSVSGAAARWFSDGRLGGTRRAQIGGQLCIPGRWCPSDQRSELQVLQKRFQGQIAEGQYAPAVSTALSLADLCGALGRLALQKQYLLWKNTSGPALRSQTSCYSPRSSRGCYKQLEKQADKILGPAPPPPATDVVYMDTSQTFQEVTGFGGAFTEAAAISFHRLNASERERLLEAYFAPPPRGNGYVLGRVAINSCDFSPASYTFDDHPGDADLKHFDDNVTHDLQTIIPFILAAQRKAAEYNRTLRILASPWSPPRWMKVPYWGGQHQVGSAQPQGLLDQHRQTWANYISRWISAYKRHGVNMWAITPQNEPEFAAPWEACVFSAEHEADWIASYLGPTLRKDHPDIKIFAYDHNKDHVARWAETIYNSPARDFVAGIAVHWYEGTQFGQLEGTHWIAQDKMIIGSEACCGLPASEKDAWYCGLSLTRDATGDLQAWGNAWLHWNLLLDSRGGPNHLGNFMAACAMLSDSGDTFTLMPAYYILAHLTRAVAPGSRRIMSNIQLSQELHPEGEAGHAAAQLFGAAFRTPQGEQTFVLINMGEEEVSMYLHITDGIRWDRPGGALVRIPPVSAHTFTWDG
eukprot:TRINITY_DN16214_c0_g1_i2.p1 TRINITY_DN16214_c0_g1~~TRINITY_DN16214_c0_g1_i2.p1  ORF type:complete len:664 (+),score=218.46 TRINITY_DN16214_c0_g1_i2:69-1994(+)